MKQYPDYKYRPRRRKSLKKPEPNHMSGANRSTLQKTHTNLHRSNSFSYDEYTFNQPRSEFERLSSSVPLASRNAASPASSSTSSPDPYQQDLHRPPYSQSGYMPINFHPKPFPNSNESYRPEVVIGQIPVPMRFTPPQEVPFPCRIEESHALRNEAYYSNMAASGEKDSDLQRSIIDDLKNLDSAEFEMYINPKDERGSLQATSDMNSNVIKSRMFSSCRQELNVAPSQQVTSSSCGQSYYWTQNGHQNPVNPSIEQESVRDTGTKYREMNDTYYEYDAQPMINALTK